MKYIKSDLGNCFTYENSVVLIKITIYKSVTEELCTNT